jgi:hypothetical protein
MPKTAAGSCGQAWDRAAWLTAIKPKSASAAVYVFIPIVSMWMVRLVDHGGRARSLAC